MAAFRLQYALRASCDGGLLLFARLWQQEEGFAVVGHLKWQETPFLMNAGVNCGGGN